MPLFDYMSHPPVLTERDRLMRLLTEDDTPPDGGGYAFDGTADLSYTTNGRTYSIEIRDITQEGTTA
jgi:hypothetical protein